MLHELEKKGFDPLKTKDLKIAIVRTSYYKEMLDSLTNKCLETLEQAGVLKENTEVVEVPGTWEVPIFANLLAAQSKYDAIVCFGIIVKGETHHFDLIKDEAARGNDEHSVRTRSANY